MREEEKWTNKRNDRQEVADSLIHNTTCHTGRRGELVVRASDSGARGRGLELHSGRRVVSLIKIHLPGSGGSVPT